MRNYLGGTTALMVALLATTSMAQAEDVEVLHWWTSGGEAAALNVLKEDLATKDIGWILAIQGERVDPAAIGVESRDEGPQLSGLQFGRIVTEVKIAEERTRHGQHSVIGQAH